MSHKIFNIQCKYKLIVLPAIRCHVLQHRHIRANKLNYFYSRHYFHGFVALLSLYKIKQIKNKMKQRKKIEELLYLPGILQPCVAPPLRANKVNLISLRQTVCCVYFHGFCALLSLHQITKIKNKMKERKKMDKIIALPGSVAPPLKANKLIFFTADSLLYLPRYLLSYTTTSYQPCLQFAATCCTALKSEEA